MNNNNILKYFNTSNFNNNLIKHNKNLQKHNKTNNLKKNKKNNFSNLIKFLMIKNKISYKNIMMII